MDRFRMHGQNKRFVKFLLARITAHIEKESGYSTSFATYYDEIDGKPFEIEHIWADRFADHREEFDQRDEFPQMPKPSRWPSSDPARKEPEFGIDAL